MAEANTETSQGDDGSLFAEITAPGATADGPADGPSEPKEQPAPSPKPPDKPGEPPPIAADSSNVPSARLREEADARRNAERRAEALQMQVEALLQRFQPVQQAPPRPRADVFENPSGFVQEEVQPLLTPLEQRLTQTIEVLSKREATREFGAQLVDQAYASVEQGLRARDPEVFALYQRATRGPDPWGDIVRWHQQKATYAQIGPDLNAYNQRILQEAMRNPDFQAQVIAAARGQAPPASVAAGQPRAPNGQFASNQQSSLPSIARVGSTGLTPEEGQDNLSDHELFAQTTSRGAKPPR